MQKEWDATYGYAPHKTPSGAFDPEVFAAPSTHSTSITELPLTSQNMVPINGHELHRTESLGLKCLSDKPLLVSQISTDSVFSRNEGETIDEYGHENEPVTPRPSLPIGIRRKLASLDSHSDQEGPHSLPIYYGNVQPMDVLTDHQGSQGHPDRHGHADCHHHHHHHTDDCCNQHEPHSIASLPDRLACEEMANAMTAMVLNDEKEQIKTNNLYQQLVLSNPNDEMANEQMNVLYKTELCRSWQFGQCKYAERCLFAHGEIELKPLKRPRHNKYKTELCLTFHAFGFCPYGSRCNFVHELDEHRPAKHSVPSLYKTRLCRTYMEKGICPYGEKCDFAHGTSDLSYDITKHPKYRTKLCRSFLESGSCVYGDRCCFSHVLPKRKDLIKVDQMNQNESDAGTDKSETGTDNDETPTKAKIEDKKKQLCRRWKYSGKCSFGDQCIYFHGTPGKRNNKRG